MQMDRRFLNISKVSYWTPFILEENEYEPASLLGPLTKDGHPIHEPLIQAGEFMEDVYNNIIFCKPVGSELRVNEEGSYDYHVEWMVAFIATSETDEDVMLEENIPADLSNQLREQGIGEGDSPFIGWDFNPLYNGYTWLDSRVREQQRESYTR